MKKMQLTILVTKGENGFIVGQLKEYPEVASQGKTMNELKLNLKDALSLHLEYQAEQFGLLKTPKDTIQKTLVFEQ